MAQIVKDSDGNVYDVDGDGRGATGRHKLNWGSIVGGVVFLLGLGTLLLWLGSALGVTLFSSYDVAGGDRSIPWATLGWLAFTVLTCFFFGSWLASRWANLWNSSDAAMHGVITWSLAVIMLSMGLTGLADTVSSAFSAAQNSTAANMQPSGSQQQSMPMYSSLKDEQFTNFVINRARSAQPQGGASGREQEPVSVTADQNQKPEDASDQGGKAKEQENAMGSKSGDIENRDALANYVSRSTNMSKEQADQFLDQNKEAIAQAQDQSKKRWAQEHSSELAQAEDARKTMSALGWSMFGLLLLSLAASIGGAYFGWHQFRKNDLGEPDTSTTSSPGSAI